MVVVKYLHGNFAYSYLQKIWLIFGKSGEIKNHVISKTEGKGSEGGYILLKY